MPSPRTTRRVWPESSRPMSTGPLAGRPTSATRSSRCAWSTAPARCTRSDRTTSCSGLPSAGSERSGIITQVTVQCVDAFDLRQTTMVETRGWVERNLERLLADHDHVSFYAYPFTDLVHVHIWDRTEAPRSPLGAHREAVNEAKAAVVAATFGDATAHLGKLPAHGGARHEAAIRHQSRVAVPRSVQPEPVPPPPGARDRGVRRAGVGRPRRGVGDLRADVCQWPPAVPVGRDPFQPCRARPVAAGCRRRTGLGLAVSVPEPVGPRR